MIRFKCDHCGATVTAPDASAGKKGRCPQCGNLCLVPEQTGNVADQQTRETPAEYVAQTSGTGGGRGSLWVYVAAGVVTVAVIAIAFVTLMPEGNTGEPVPGPLASSKRQEPAGQPDTQVADEADESAEDSSSQTEAPEADPDPEPVEDAETAAETQDRSDVTADSQPDEHTTAETPPAVPVRAPTGRWNPQSRADVKAVVFGSSNEENADSIVDMVALDDASLLVCGTIHGLDGWGEGVPVRRPGAGAGGVGENCGFVAKVTHDLTGMEWVAILPPNTIEPTRMAVGPDGSIYIGGGKGSEISTLAPDQDWEGRQSVIARLSPDGSDLLWVRSGGPNQNPVTGLDVDQQGRVYWTAGTVGRSQAAYLLRLNADGSPSEWEYEGTRGWVVDLHHSDEQLNQEGQYWWYYKRGWNEGNEDGFFDYDGEGGWAPVKFWLRGIRQGGQVVVLPDGDIVVSGTMQYDFQVKGQRGFPAFDVFLARYRSDGKLLWSTNLYQEGDSVHTPDQKARDLHYDPNTGNLYMVAWQHGSNQYRFKGNLVGDTGNMAIFWVGRVNANNGELLDGWYFHNIKPGSNGRFQEDGTPTGWPDLSGNNISAVGTDDRGRVYVTGRGAPVTWTCENAHQSWPDEQWSRYGFLYVLTPELDDILYATIIRGTEKDNEGNVIGQSAFNGLAVTPAGVYVAGWTDIPMLQVTRESPLMSFFGVDVDDGPAWVSHERGKADAAIVRFQWE
ncbi:MAG: hypothetical protein ACP5HU_07690 [Phycisphaerae bacterium]